MKKRTGFFFLLFLVLLHLSGCAQVWECTTEVPQKNGGAGEGEALQTEILTLEDVVSFETSCHSTYAYNRLSEAQKLWYEEINAMLSKRSDIPVTLSMEGMQEELDEEEIDKIFQCVLTDHPEYFFVDGYQYTIYSAMGERVGMELKGSYTLSLEECLQRKEEIDTAVFEILKEAPTDGSDYEKAKYVYETIIYNTEYYMDAQDNQNIYSVFVGQASVCQGYAKATQYLLNQLGVECTLVFGKVNDGEGHTWNLVLVEGEYYYVDTTWGDASYLTDEGSVADGGVPDINYDYLCVTTKQLEITHVMEPEFALPVCTAMENNYYVKEGFYFTSYDREHLDKVFEEAVADGRPYVTVKCSAEDIYDDMLEELIENQGIFAYLGEDYEEIAYIANKQQLSLTFWMTNQPVI